MLSAYIENALELTKITKSGKDIQQIRMDTDSMEKKVLVEVKRMTVFERFLSDKERKLLEERDDIFYTSPENSEG